VKGKDAHARGTEGRLCRTHAHLYVYVSSIERKGARHHKHNGVVYDALETSDRSDREERTMFFANTFKTTFVKTTGCFS
jgi:hypothetical protein